MITVKKMIEELQKYPPDAMCYAYQGESDCVVIVSSDSGKDGKHLGYIDVYEEWLHDYDDWCE